MTETRTVRKKVAPNRKRVPVSGRRDLLTVDHKEPGYVYRWVNDVEANIQKHLDAGYVFSEPSGKLLGEVTQDNNPEVRESVASKYVGRGITAYLLAQREEWYEEDQKAKQKEVDRSEEALNKTGQDGRYGDVRISRL